MLRRPSSKSSSLQGSTNSAFRLPRLRSHASNGNHDHGDDDDDNNNDDRHKEDAPEVAHPSRRSSLRGMGSRDGGSNDFKKKQTQIASNEWERQHQQQQQRSHRPPVSVPSSPSSNPRSPLGMTPRLTPASIVGSPSWHPQQQQQELGRHRPVTVDLAQQTPPKTSLSQQGYHRWVVRQMKLEKRNNSSNHRMIVNATIDDSPTARHAHWKTAVPPLQLEQCRSDMLPRTTTTTTSMVTAPTPTAEPTNNRRLPIHTKKGVVVAFPNGDDRMILSPPELGRGVMESLFAQEPHNQDNIAESLPLAMSPISSSKQREGTTMTPSQSQPQPRRPTDYNNGHNQQHNNPVEDGVMMVTSSTGGLIPPGDWLDCPVRVVARIRPMHDYEKRLYPHPFVYPVDDHDNPPTTQSRSAMMVSTLDTPQQQQQLSQQEQPRRRARLMSRFSTSLRNLASATTNNNNNGNNSRRASMISLQSQSEENPPDFPIAKRLQVLRPIKAPAAVAAAGSQPPGPHGGTYPPATTTATTFDFDAVLGPTASQQMVYDACMGKQGVVREMLFQRKQYLTVLTYGLSGSGKTFTMQGHDTGDFGGPSYHKDEQRQKGENDIERHPTALESGHASKRGLSSSLSQMSENDGILHRAIQDLFQSRDEFLASAKENHPGTQVLIELACFEICQDELRDLLVSDDPLFLGGNGPQSNTPQGETTGNNNNNNSNHRSPLVLREMGSLHDHPNDGAASMEQRFPDGLPVEGLRKVLVTSVAQCRLLIQQAILRRAISMTARRQVTAASQSHAVFNLVVTFRSPRPVRRPRRDDPPRTDDAVSHNPDLSTTTTNVVWEERRATLTLLDMAGSEKMSSKPNEEQKLQQQQQQSQEPPFVVSTTTTASSADNRTSDNSNNITPAQATNKSVVDESSLRTGQHVDAQPTKSTDRDDVAADYGGTKIAKVLTSIIADSIAGNSLTILVACVAPGKAHLRGSLETLQYAANTRSVVQAVQTVRLNMVDDGALRSLDADNPILHEINRLRTRLDKYKRKNLVLRTKYIEQQRLLESMQEKLIILDHEGLKNSPRSVAIAGEEGSVDEFVISKEEPELVDRVQKLMFQLENERKRREKSETKCMQLMDGMDQLKLENERLRRDQCSKTAITEPTVTEESELSCSLEMSLQEMVPSSIDVSGKNNEDASSFHEMSEIASSSTHTLDVARDGSGMDSVQVKSLLSFPRSYEAQSTMFDADEEHDDGELGSDQDDHVETSDNETDELRSHAAHLLSMADQRQRRRQSRLVVERQHNNNESENPAASESVKNQVSTSRSNNDRVGPDPAQTKRLLTIPRLYEGRSALQGKTSDNDNDSIRADELDDSGGEDDDDDDADSNRDDKSASEIDELRSRAARLLEMAESRPHRRPASVTVQSSSSGALVCRELDIPVAHKSENTESERSSMDSNEVKSLLSIPRFFETNPSAFEDDESCGADGPDDKENEASEDDGSVLRETDELRSRAASLLAMADNRPRRRRRRPSPPMSSPATILRDDDSHVHSQPESVDSAQDPIRCGMERVNMDSNQIKSLLSIPRSYEAKSSEFNNDHSSCDEDDEAEESGKDDESTNCETDELRSRAATLLAMADNRPRRCPPPPHKSSSPPSLCNHNSQIVPQPELDKVARDLTVRGRERVDLDSTQIKSLLTFPRSYERKSLELEDNQSYYDDQESDDEVEQSNNEDDATDELRSRAASLLAMADSRRHRPPPLKTLQPSGRDNSARGDLEDSSLALGKAETELISRDPTHVKSLLTFPRSYEARTAISGDASDNDLDSCDGAEDQGDETDESGRGSTYADETDELRARAASLLSMADKRLERRRVAAIPDKSNPVGAHSPVHRFDLNAVENSGRNSQVNLGSSLSSLSLNKPSNGMDPAHVKSLLSFPRPYQSASLNDMLQSDEECYESQDDESNDSCSDTNDVPNDNNLDELRSHAALLLAQADERIQRRRHAPISSLSVTHYRPCTVEGTNCRENWSSMQTANETCENDFLSSDSHQDDCASSSKIFRVIHDEAMNHSESYQDSNYLLLLQRYDELRKDYEALARQNSSGLAQTLVDDSNNSLHSSPEIIWPVNELAVKMKELESFADISTEQTQNQVPETSMMPFKVHDESTNEMSCEGLVDGSSFTQMEVTHDADFRGYAERLLSLADMAIQRKSPHSDADRIHHILLLELEKERSRRVALEERCRMLYTASNELVLPCRDGDLTQHEPTPSKPKDNLELASSLQALPASTSELGDPDRSNADERTLEEVNDARKSVPLAFFSSSDDDFRIRAEKLISLADKTIEMRQRSGHAVRSQVNTSSSTELILLVELEHERSLREKGEFLIESMTAEIDGLKSNFNKLIEHHRMLISESGISRTASLGDLSFLGSISGEDEADLTSRASISLPYNTKRSNGGWRSTKDCHEKETHILRRHSTSSALSVADEPIYGDQKGEVSNVVHHNEEEKQGVDVRNGTWGCDDEDAAVGCGNGAALQDYRLHAQRMLCWADKAIARVRAAGIHSGHDVGDGSVMHLLHRLVLEVKGERSQREVLEHEVISVRNEMEKLRRGIPSCWKCGSMSSQQAISGTRDHIEQCV